MARNRRKAAARSKTATDVSKGAWRPIAQKILQILLSIIGAGCTTVSIGSTDGHTKIARSLGFASISVSPTIAPVLVEVTALGFTAGPAGYAVGFSNQQLVAIPETCRVIFWIRNEPEARAIQSLL